MATLEDIDRKLDLLLAALRPSLPPPPPADEFMTVLATQGAEAAHKWQKDKMKQRRKSS